MLGFIEDELLRVPLTLNPVIDAVQQRWRLRMPGLARDDHRAERTLQHQREALIAQAVAAVRHTAMADVQRMGAKAPAGTASPWPARRELALIGEEDVAADIEIARCIEMAKQMAELELRELATFTSALADDQNVARETNPFRPELFVRALWEAIHAMPLSKVVQTAFLRDAAEPLAKALRSSYAAASSRLEDQGVVPAAYRTIVQNVGTGWGGQLPRYRPPEHLDQLRGSMAPTPDSERTAQALTSAAASPQFPWTAPQAQAPADPHLVELLAQVFAAMQSDNGLSTDVVALLARLQTTVTRIALGDRSLMDDYAHPAWRFIDQLAYQLALCAPAERMRMLSLGRHLVDHLASGDVADRSRFDWAIDRMVAAHRHALQQAVAAAAPAIARMQHKARSAVPVLGGDTALDAGNLDTVPAGLARPETPPLFDPTGESPGAPGDHWRIYLQGDWRWVQMLWRDEDNAVWLMREPSADQHWALRASGIERLRQEGLAHPLRMRSLVKRAAAKLARHGVG